MSSRRVLIKKFSNRENILNKSGGKLRKISFGLKTFLFNIHHQREGIPELEYSEEIDPTKLCISLIIDLNPACPTKMLGRLFYSILSFCEPVLPFMKVIMV